MPLNPSAMRNKVIEKLNASLINKGELWRAGDTPFSRIAYEDKKIMFGGSVPNLQGAEYYIGGILDLGSETSGVLTNQASPYVPDFDWRTRHGANIKGSPYFQDEYNGWITSIKSQGICGSCWAFSAVGAVEAAAKLYFNTTEEFDLSEQELISCSTAGDCDGGHTDMALDYICNGIQDENSFPYKECEPVSCSDKKQPEYVISIHNTKRFFDNTTQNLNKFQKKERMKSMLLKSPVAGTFTLWHHAMTIVGYKTLKAGDRIYMNKMDTTSVIIQPGDSRIGRIVWIFKNCWGDEWGDHGYMYALTDINNLYTSAQPMFPFIRTRYDKNGNVLRVDSASVRYRDEDRDGYYWWGIGPRPDNLPSNAKEGEDSDDSNRLIGPMDSFGHQEVIQGYDLYIKDNIDDKGYEPNLTIENDNYWSAPEIYVRHKQDSVLEHQNPKADSLNYVFIRVWNRGNIVSPPARLKLFWAKAGTNLEWPKMWNGDVKIDGLALGNEVNDYARIHPIMPGESEVVMVRMQTPDPSDFVDVSNQAIGGENSWHFCLLAQIFDAGDDNLRKDGNHVPIREYISANNNVAQKNVTVIDNGDNVQEATISVINDSSETGIYTIDLIDITPFDVSSVYADIISVDTLQLLTPLFTNAKVTLKLSPQIQSSWIAGGRKYSNAGPTEDEKVHEVYSNRASFNDIILPAHGFGLVKFKANFTTTLPFGSKPKKYTVLLRQKDQNNNVIGGETIEIIQSPRTQIVPVIEQQDDNGKVSATVTNVNEDATYKWFDGNNQKVADGKTLTLSPLKDSKYRVEVTAEQDGYMSSAETTIKAGKIELNVTPVPVNSYFNVSYSIPQEGMYSLILTNLDTQHIADSWNISSGNSEMYVDAAPYMSGLYSLSLRDVDGHVIKDVKFRIN